MNLLSKKFSLAFAGIIFLYFFTRLINLTVIPIFNDESIYIRYGIHELREPGHAPYSLLIGKEPLMPFLYAIGNEIFNGSLYGARVVSVVFGFFTVLGIYFVVKNLENNRAALIACLFYVFLPFTFFFDRLALMDNAVVTIGVWSLFFTIRLLKNNKWTDMLLLGILTGIGLWIKSSAYFYVFLPVVSYVLYAIFLKRFKITLLFNLIFSVAIAGTIFLPLYLNPLYVFYTQQNKIYTLPFISFFSFPLVGWVENVQKILVWNSAYLTPLFFCFSLVSFFRVGFVKKNTIVSLWFLIPLVYIVLFAKMLTGRYILLFCMPLIILSAIMLHKIGSKFLTLALIIAIFIPSTFFIIVLVFVPQKYIYFLPGPANQDMKQYFTGSSSGYGVMEAVNYLKKRAENEKITVITRDDHGNPEDAVIGFLSYNKNLEVVPYKNLIVPLDTMLKDIKHKDNAYFVSRSDFLAGTDKYFKKDMLFFHPDNKSFVGVYKLDPSTLP